MVSAPPSPRMSTAPTSRYRTASRERRMCLTGTRQSQCGRCLSSASLICSTCVASDFCDDQTRFDKKPKQKRSGRRWHVIMEGEWQQSGRYYSVQMSIKVSRSQCFFVKFQLVRKQEQSLKGAPATLATFCEVLWFACLYVCCLSVSLSVLLSQKPHVQPSCNFCICFNYCSCGSVLLWRQCNRPTLRTSGFMDDVMNQRRYVSSTSPVGGTWG